MKTQTQMNWSKYLSVFSEQNRDRPTRLGVHEGPPGSMLDVWLEDGLPLINVDAAAGPEGIDVEITLGNTSTSGPAHMTHRVPNARRIRLILGITDEMDGLNIDTGEGRSTVLRFEG